MKPCFYDSSYYRAKGKVENQEEIEIDLEPGRVGKGFKWCRTPKDFEKGRVDCLAQVIEVNSSHSSPLREVYFLLHTSI